MQRSTNVEQQVTLKRVPSLDSGGSDDPRGGSVQDRDTDHQNTDRHQGSIKEKPVETKHRRQYDVEQLNFSRIMIAVQDIEKSNKRKHGVFRDAGRYFIHRVPAVRLEGEIR